MEPATPNAAVNHLTTVSSIVRNTDILAFFLMYFVCYVCDMFFHKRLHNKAVKLMQYFR